MLWRMRGYQPHANLLFLVALASAPGANALEANKRIDVDFEVGVVSDYRFRGLTLTGKDPALQAGLTVSLANGAYSNIWASTIDEYGAGPDGKGAIFEMDGTLGWAGRVGLRPFEAHLSRADLAAADEAFLCSSVAGILPVTRFDGAPIGAGTPGPWTLRARADRESMIHGGGVR